MSSLGNSPWDVFRAVTALIEDVQDLLDNLDAPDRDVFVDRVRDSIERLRRMDAS